jgi:hypothetical protein
VARISFASDPLPFRATQCTSRNASGCAASSASLSLVDRDPYASNPHAQEVRRDKSLPGTEAVSNDLLLDEENGGDKPAEEEEKRCMTVVVRGSRHGVPDWCESSLTFLVQFLDQFLISNRYP